MNHCEDVVTSDEARGNRKQDRARFLVFVRGRSVAAEEEGMGIYLLLERYLLLSALSGLLLRSIGSAVLPFPDDLEHG